MNIMPIKYDSNQTSFGQAMLSKTASKKVLTGVTAAMMGLATATTALCHEGNKTNADTFEKCENKELVVSQTDSRNKTEEAEKAEKKDALKAVLCMFGLLGVGGLYALADGLGWINKPAGDWDPEDSFDG